MPALAFAYGAGGQRILKQVGDPALGTGFREHYIRDAQGNIMAVYKYTNNGTASTQLVERPVYGSSRLGSYAKPQEVMGSGLISNQHTAPLLAADQRYELTDHLGNVATVVTGRLLPGNGAGSAKQAEVVSATLHEPFGLNLTGMNWQSDQARFGFQGQIKELEMNAIHFKYREYSLDGGGFWSVDPVAAQYPHNSPYSFSENRVVDGVELEGLQRAPGRRGRHIDPRTEEMYRGLRDERADRAIRNDPHARPITPEQLRHWTIEKERNREQFGETAIQIETARSVSESKQQWIPRGSLEANEGGTHGGHTMAKRVGLTGPQLAERLANEPHRNRVSSFTDIPEAELGITTAISSNQAAIGAWQSGNSPSITITAPFSGGTVQWRGPYAPQQGSTVVVRLSRTSDGYAINSAFVDAPLPGSTPPLSGGNSAPSGGGNPPGSGGGNSDKPISYGILII